MGLLCPREGGCVARARTFEIDFDLLARRAAPGGSRPRTSEKRGGGGAAASASASAPTVAIDQPAASHRHVHGQRDKWVWGLPKGNRALGVQGVRLSCARCREAHSQCHTPKAEKPELRHVGPREAASAAAACAGPAFCCCSEPRTEIRRVSLHSGSRRWQCRTPQKRPTRPPCAPDPH